MSIERARTVLGGGRADRHVLMDDATHREFVRYLTGLDCMVDTEEAISQAVHKLDIDIFWCGFPQNRDENVENDPNLFGLNPTGWRNADTTKTDVLEHDPADLRPELLLDEAAFTEKFRCENDRNKQFLGDTALNMGYLFTTCFHYAAEDLDYEEFLCASITHPDEISANLERYEAASRRYIDAWCRLPIEVMLCHDDIANSNSLTLSPDFFRENIFPRYKRLFAPIKEKNIPLLCMTDGNFIEVAQDYLDVGADGFFVDRPTIELEPLVKIAGEDKLYFTGPTPAIMTCGSPADVAYEMDMLAEIAKNIPGFMYHMAGGWAKNMPLENVKVFYQKQNRI